MFKRSVSPNCNKKQRKHYRCEMNNGTYEGDILLYRKDGIGMFIHDEGSTYFGGFQKDNFHGEGVLLFKIGGMLFGQFERGKLNGFAILFFQDNYICGYFSQSIMNGRIFFYNGSMKLWRFSEYQNGKKMRDISEEAVEDVKSLPQFLIKDQFLAHKFINFLDFHFDKIVKKNVNCSLSLLECDQNPQQKYIGFIDRSGNLNGLGCILTNDSLQMCGNYEDGKIQGLGRTLHDNGDIYDGFFRKDQMEGQGIYYTESTNSYIYAYFKRNECIKIINGGVDYPVELIKRMKQKIHEKSVDYLSGFINFKGIGINIAQIFKSIKDDQVFAAKRQKNQYFDMSRCDAIEDEEQILKRADFIHQDQSSRTSYRKTANGSSMHSTNVGAKLQIYNQNANRMISVQPFQAINQNQEDNINNQSHFNQSSIIDIQDLERVSPPLPRLSSSHSNNSNNTKRSITPSKRIFTQENVSNSKMPVLEKFLNTKYQKDMLSQRSIYQGNEGVNGMSHSFTNRSSANPNLSLREISNVQQNHLRNSQINQGSIHNLPQRNIINNQSSGYEQHQLVSSLLFNQQDINQSTSQTLGQQQQIYSPERNKLSRSKIFGDHPINQSQQINNANNSSNFQRELSFSPVRSQSQSGNYMAGNLSGNKSQRQSPSSNISRGEQMSPVGNRQRQQVGDNSRLKKYQPIFQDTTQSSIRLSTTRQLQNSSFLQTGGVIDDLSASQQQAFNQLSFSPIKQKKLIFQSNRDHSAPILNSRIETPKLNLHILFDKRQSPQRIEVNNIQNRLNGNKISTRFNASNQLNNMNASIHVNNVNASNHANNVNEVNLHNQKLKMQINQSKYYSPSFNPSSMTLGDVIRSSQQNSIMQQSPSRNLSNRQINNSQMQSSRYTNIFNQENRPNYAGYNLNSQILNTISGQQPSTNHFQFRNLSPPSPLKSSKTNIFQESAQPHKRQQNLNVNVSFQDQTQDYQISDSLSASTYKDSSAIKLNKSIVPTQLDK